MKYQKFFHVIVISLIGFLLTACTSKVTMTPFELERVAKEQARQQLIKDMLFESSYVYKGYKVVRFYQGRFLIYDDITKAPTFYGVVKLDGNIMRFVSKKREIKQTFDINQTALILTAGKRVNTLLKQNDHISFYQPQTIFEAIRFGTIEDLNVLLNEEMALDEPDDLGELPLAEAVYYNRFEMVEALLDAKADIFAPNANGHTPLHVAIEARNIEMMRLLLNRGASKQLKYCEELLPVLQKDESFRTSKMLIASGMNPSCLESSLLFWVISSEVLAKKNQTLAALDYLLSEHVKTDVVSPDQGDTPLMRAAAIGNDKIVKKLIDHGINLFKKDHFGRTALDYDSLYLSDKNPKIALLLHEAGLHTGVNADADRLYEETQRLYKYHNYKKAYETYKKLAEKYKQKRFYQGMIDAGLALKDPDKKTIKALMENFAYLNHEQTEYFYLTMIGFYQKMLKFAHDKEDVDRHGNFKKGSVWHIYEKIDRLYISLYEKFPKTVYLHKRWQNYKKFKGLRKLKRQDIKSESGVRYVGETLDGMPFGKGALQYTDGSKYYGDVFNYIRHGKGKITYTNGQIYDGQWVEDKKEGKGFFTDENNALYLSDFKNNDQIGLKKLVRAGH